MIAAKVRSVIKAATSLKHAVVSVIAVIVLGLTEAAAQPPNVSITDLGTLPGDHSSAAIGINARGQIVGWSEGSVPGEYHAVLWQNGTIVRLTGLDFAFGINDSGQVVGQIRSGSGSEYRGDVVVWQNGRAAVLETLPGGFYSFAPAISGRGEIAGYCVTGSIDEPQFHAVVWKAGAITELRTLPGAVYCIANAINDRGDVAGWCQSGSGEQAHADAVLWRNGKISKLASLPEGGTGSGLMALNNRGQLVGEADVSGAPHAALWQLGTIADLGTLPGDTESSANGINDCGQIVGQSFLGPDPYQRHALLWIGGNMVQLEVLPGEETSYPSAINNSGQIVGSSGDHAVVWQIEPPAPWGPSRSSRPFACPGGRP